MNWPTARCSLLARGRRSAFGATAAPASYFAALAMPTAMVAAAHVARMVVWSQIVILLSSGEAGSSRLRHINAETA
jgi:hypothetical protein